MIKKKSNKKRRRVLTGLIIGAVVLFLALVAQFAVYRYNFNRSILFRTEGSRLQIYRDKKWREFTVKGINMGIYKSGYTGEETGITREEYKRWFKQIAAMNANVIRIHTILSPEFYQAFYEYNIIAKKPLYLLQGIWVDENKPYTNAYDDRLNSLLFEKIQLTIDVIHGKTVLKQGNSGSSGKYNLNISPYVMGYILGKEMDADFVIATNEKNTQVMGFEGDYLYTDNATPYEAWLAALGNYAISYEQEKYGGPFKLISWINWPATDPLVHFYTQDINTEKKSGVDFEHIHTTEKFYSGIFASYYVYPSNPDLIKYQAEYSDYIDNKGYMNQYEGYLNEIRSHHSMPVLAAEFGIPVSGGSVNQIQVYASTNGYTEKEQGEAAAEVFESIINAGFAGGIVFAWHDDTEQEQSYSLLALESSGDLAGGNERLRDSYTIIQRKFAEY